MVHKTSSPFRLSQSPNHSESVEQQFIGWHFYDWILLYCDTVFAYNSSLAENFLMKKPNKREENRREARTFVSLGESVCMCVDSTLLKTMKCTCCYFWRVSVHVFLFSVLIFQQHSSLFPPPSLFLSHLSRSLYHQRHLGLLHFSLQYQSHSICLPMYCGTFRFFSVAAIKWVWH